MLLRTHLGFAILMIILFVEHVTEKWIFVGVVLVATILPDLDSGFSTWGRHMIFKPLQFFTAHRGILHSFTFAILISILLSIFFPVAAFGFFVGYSVHLISDSFTKEGVQAFWPLSGRSHGLIKSGGRVEDGLFILIMLADVLLFLIFFVL